MEDWFDAPPRVRLRVLARMMLGSDYSYQDIADELGDGVSEYQVSKIVNAWQAKVEQTGVPPERLLIQEFISGGADLFANSNWGQSESS